VRLKDGNKLNCAPENLMLIRRADHIRLNYRPRRSEADGCVGGAAEDGRMNRSIETICR